MRKFSKILRCILFSSLLVSNITSISYSAPIPPIKYKTEEQRLIGTWLVSDADCKEIWTFTNEPHFTKGNIDKDWKKWYWFGGSKANWHLHLKANTGRWKIRDNTILLLEYQGLKIQHRLGTQSSESVGLPHETTYIQSFNFIRRIPRYELGEGK